MVLVWKQTPQKHKIVLFKKMKEIRRWIKLEWLFIFPKMNQNSPSENKVQCSAGCLACGAHSWMAGKPPSPEESSGPSWALKPLSPKQQLHEDKDTCREGSKPHSWLKRRHVLTNLFHFSKAFFFTFTKMTEGGTAMEALVGQMGSHYRSRTGCWTIT